MIGVKGLKTPCGVGGNAPENIIYHLKHREALLSKLCLFKHFQAIIYYLRHREALLTPDPIPLDFYPQLGRNQDDRPHYHQYKRQGL